VMCAIKRGTKGFVFLMPKKPKAIFAAIAAKTDAPPQKRTSKDQTSISGIANRTKFTAMPPYRTRLAQSDDRYCVMFLLTSLVDAKIVAS